MTRLKGIITCVLILISALSFSQSQPQYSGERVLDIINNAVEDANSNIEIICDERYQYDWIDPITELKLIGKQYLQRRFLFDENFTVVQVVIPSKTGKLPDLYSEYEITSITIKHDMWYFNLKTPDSPVYNGRLDPSYMIVDHKNKAILLGRELEFADIYFFSK